MTTVNPVTTNAAYALPLDQGMDPGSTASLTPDALMTYCQTRLQGLDSQMEKYFQDQQSSYAAQQALTQVQSMIGNVTANGFSMSSSTNGNAHCGTDILINIQHQIDAVGKDTPAGQALTNLRQTIAHDLDPSGHLENALTSDAPHTLQTMVAGSQAHRTDSDLVRGLGGQPPDGDKVDANTVQGWGTTAKNITTDLNNSGQMGMIQLQSLMSARQTAIQLCTNLVQSLGDQANKIAGNVGH